MSEDLIFDIFGMLVGSDDNNIVRGNQKNISKSVNTNVDIEDNSRIICNDFETQVPQEVIEKIPPQYRKIVKQSLKNRYENNSNHTIIYNPTISVNINIKID